MGELTIHGIDDELKRRLELRAAANGRSLDEELRAALEQMTQEREDVVRPAGPLLPPIEMDEAYRARLRSRTLPSLRLTEEEITRRLERIRALGRKPDEPFDLKAFSDALSDGTE